MSDLASDSLNQPVVDFADVADLYELCACRKEQTMRVCRSHEALRRERDELLKAVKPLDVLTRHTDTLQSMVDAMNNYDSRDNDMPGDEVPNDE